MRIIKLFKNHVLALACAVALIVISCNADLALPTYMSEIVDVGIQQGGIESPAPDTICAESLSDLELFMPEDDMATVEAAYSEPDAEGIRTYVGSEADRAEDGAVSDADFEDIVTAAEAEASGDDGSIEVEITEEDKTEE